jgi:Family of unknown function (DUF6326)
LGVLQHWPIKKHIDNLIMSNIPLDKAHVNIRIKLVALWAAVMFFYIYGDYFALYIPGQAGKLVTGDTLLNSPIKVFAASVLMSFPSLVIILTILSTPALARWVNIIFGIIFTGIMVLIAATSIPLTPEIAAYVFYAIVESCITLLIVWLAWKWPRVTKTSDTPDDLDA